MHCLLHFVLCLAQKVRPKADMPQEIAAFLSPKEELEERLNNAKNALTNVDKAITQTVEALKGLDTTEENRIYQVLHLF